MGYNEKFKRLAHAEGSREGHGGNQHDERRRHGNGKQRRSAASGVDHRAGEWSDGIGNSNGDGECHEQHWSGQCAIPVGWGQCGQPGNGGALHLQLGYDEKFKRLAHAEGGREGHGGNQHDERRRHGNGEQRRGGASGIDHRTGEWSDGIGNSNGDGECHEQHWSGQCAIPVGRGQCGQPGNGGALHLQLGYDEKFKRLAHAEGGREGHGGNQHDERRRHGNGEQRRSGAGGLDHRTGEWSNGIGNSNGDGECHEQHWSGQCAIPVGWGQCGQSGNGGALHLQLGYDEKFKRLAHAEGGREGHGGNQHDERRRHGNGEQRRSAASGVDHRTGEWSDSIRHYHGIRNGFEQPLDLFCPGISR